MPISNFDGRVQHSPIVRAAAIEPGGFFFSPKYRYLLQSALQHQNEYDPTHTSTTHRPTFRRSCCTGRPIRPASPAARHHCRTSPKELSGAASRCSPVAPAPWAWPNPTKVHAGSQRAHSVPTRQKKFPEAVTEKKRRFSTIEQLRRLSFFFLLLFPHSAVSHSSILPRTSRTRFPSRRDQTKRTS